MRDSRVDFLIVVPEELCVAKTRHEDALGVAPDNLGLLRLRVRHRQEGRLERAVLVHHGKVVLVVNHGGRQHFLGEREKLRREVSRDDRWVFHEVRHFLQK